MKNHVNLLPWKYQRRYVVERLLKRWALVWLAAAVVGLGVWAVGRGEQRDRRDLVHSLERKSAPVQKLQARLDQMNLQLGRLQERTGPFLELQQGPNVLSAIGFVSRDAKQCGGRIWVERFILQYSPRTRPDQPAKAARSQIKTPEAISTLKLEGLAQDNLALAEFVSYLRDNEVFRNVELKSSVKAKFEGFSGRSYLVECTF